MTDKILQATALHYSGKGAPLVVAKGKGESAKALVELGKQAGIPIHEDAYLSEYLNMLEQGEVIPPELYHIIAEILAFIYLLEGKMPPGWEQEILPGFSVQS